LLHVWCASVAQYLLNTATQVV